MSAEELLAGLRARGVCLDARGERLAFDGPAGALTGEDLALLREHKAAILALLAAEAHGPNWHKPGWHTCIDCGAPKQPGAGYWCLRCLDRMRREREKEEAQ